MDDRTMDSNASPSRPRPWSFLVSIVLAAALFSSAGIHLDLYLTGYRHIPTIGWLFLLQVLAFAVTAFAVLVVPRPVVLASAALLGASTLGGYLLSRAVGLFGFHEVPTTAGSIAGAVELIAVVVAVLGLSIQQTVPTRLVRLSGAAVVVAGAVLLGIAGGSGTTGDHAATSTSSQASQLTIVIKNFAFSPANFTVHPGERITIKNEDSVAHTFTAQPGTSPLGNFNTGPIQPGAEKTVVLPETAGVYDFYCGIHPFMTGAVRVG